MKFLVIGASGFVGRHLVSHVRTSGCTALGTRFRTHVPGLVSFDLLKQRIADCVEASFFDTDEPVVGVICAAISQLDRCYRERTMSKLVNVDNMIRLIDDLVALHVKPVFLSSSFVYDGRRGDYTEDDLPCANTEYGRHKAAIEKYIKQNVPGALLLRMDKIVGDDPSESHMFSQWNDTIKMNKAIVCIKGQFFALTFIHDVVKAIETGCCLGLTGLYNMANPQAVYRSDLAKTFVSLLGRTTQVLSRPQTDFDFLDERPLKSNLNSTKFIKATGFRFTKITDVIKSFQSKLHIDDTQGVLM